MNKKIILGICIVLVVALVITLIVMIAKKDVEQKENNDRVEKEESFYIGNDAAEGMEPINKDMELGIDIEQNERFKDISEKFKNRAFTPSEIEYAEKRANKHQVYCSFWCVKEAAVKAFSNRALDFQQVMITATEEGRPYIIKNDYIKTELKKLGMSEIKISISHAKDYSTAICIIY
jgi:holo-[acyl-carrier protein] synthase